jgi:ABC-2 type transport system ATP-binding protein
VNEPILQGRSLSRRYKQLVALAPIDVSLFGGESLALVGPNGAGKSTLLSLLAKALRPSSGSVVIGPQARIGWLPQRPAHYGRLTARENLVLFARLERHDDPLGRADELLTRFSLPDDRQSRLLSVGNRQRLSLAIALVPEPNVLLLDEPTAALDPRQRALLWQEIERYRQGGGAVCFSSQNLEEIERHSSRVIALEDGQLAFTGGPQEYAVWEREP